MSHLIKIYAVCKFSYFRLWLLKSLETKIAEFANSIDIDEAAPHLDLHHLSL